MFSYKNVFARKSTKLEHIAVPFSIPLPSNTMYFAQQSRIRQCKRDSHLSFTEIMAQLGSEKIEVIPDKFAPSIMEATIEFGNIICGYYAAQPISQIKSLFRHFQHIFPNRSLNKIFVRRNRHLDMTLGNYLELLNSEYLRHKLLPTSYKYLDTARDIRYIHAMWFVDYVDNQDSVLTRSSGWKNFVRLLNHQNFNYEILSDMLLFNKLYERKEKILNVEDDAELLLREFFDYYLLAMDNIGIPIATALSRSDVVAQIGVDVNVHIPFFERFFQNKTVEELFENAKFSHILDSDFMERVKVRCVSMCTIIYNLCRWSQGKLLMPDLIVNLTSSLVNCMPLSVLHKVFSDVFGLVAQDDMATITIIIKCICVAMFILTAKSLPGKKTIDELINRIYTIPRAMSGLNNFWTSIDSVVQKIVDFVDEHIYGSDITAKQAKYIDTVQQWADQVANYSDLFKRREINKDTDTLRGAARLHMDGIRLLMQCQRQGYDRKNAELIRSLLATTYKISEAALKSGADKSRVRMEPLMIWFNGPSGIGKSTMSYPFILDIMKAMGQDMSKWEQNIYARAPETEYWDGYTDQEYIIYDDAFQLRDSVAKPSIELFEMIRLGNLFPYQLHMASIEEKNNTFAQPKLVYLSSNLGHIQAQSIHFPEAVERRIDFAYRVSLKESYRTYFNTGGRDTYKLDTSKCNISPDNPIDFRAYQFEQYNPHTHEQIGEAISYPQMLAKVIEKMKSKQVFYSSMSNFLNQYKDRPIPTIPPKYHACSTRHHINHSQVGNDYDFVAEHMHEIPHFNGVHTTANNKLVLMPGYKMAEKWYEIVGCAMRNVGHYVARTTAIVTADAVCSSLNWWSPDWHICGKDFTNLYMAADNMRINQDQWFRRFTPANEYYSAHQMQQHQLQLRETLAGIMTYQDKDEAFNDRYILAQCDVDRVKSTIQRWKQWVSASFWTAYKKVRYNLPGLCLKTLGILTAVGAFYQIYRRFCAPVVKTLQEKLQDIQKAIDQAEKCVASGECSTCKNCCSMTEKDLLDVQYWGVSCKCYIDVCKKQKMNNRRLFMAYINTKITTRPRDVTVQARLAEFAQTCDCENCPLCEDECECRRIALQKGVSIGDEDLLDRSGIYGRMQHEVNEVISQGSPIGKNDHRGKQIHVQGSPIGKNDFRGRQIHVQNESTYICPQKRLKPEAQYAPMQRIMKSVEKLDFDADKKNDLLKKFRKADEAMDLFIASKITTDAEITPQGNIITQAKCNEIYDFNGNAILENRLWPNLLRMYIVSPEDNQIVRHFGHVLGLKGSCFLTNWHFILCLRQKMYADCQVVLRSMQNLILYQDTISNFTSHVTKIDNKDACIVCLNKTRTIQSFPNIVKHFQPKAVSYSREAQSLTVVRYSVYKDTITPSPIIVMDASLISEPKEITMQTREGSVTFINPISWLYQACTRAGDCGAPLMLNNARIPTKIVGIHNAACYGTGDAYGVPLYQEEIQQALNTIPAQFQYGWEDAEPLSTLEVVNFQDGENFLVVGCKNERIPTNTKSCIRPSEISGLFMQPQTMPGFLRPFTDASGQIIDPVQMARKKWGYHQPAIDDKIALKATNFCVQLLVNKTSIDYKEYHIPMTTEEAIIGIPGIDHLNSINKMTSPGYPYILNKRAGKGKTGYFGVFDFDLTKEGAQEVIKKVHEMETSMLHNVRPQVIWVDTMKDARISIEKAMKGKTRVFSASSMDYVILYRKYFLPFFGHVMHNRISNFTAPGINPLSPEWHKLALKMRSRGSKVIAGDYSNYDGKACVEGYKAALKATQEWYKIHWDEIIEQQRNVVSGRVLDQSEFLSLLDKIFFEVVNHIHACNYSTEDGEKILFYQVTNGMPSGNPGTAVTNSVCGIWMFVYCWLRMSDTPQLRQYNTIQSFYDNVYMCTYGDDVVANISDAVIEWFNQSTLTVMMKESFDIDFTDEEKTGTIVSYRQLSDIRFLKRAFAFNEYLQIYVAPLPEDVILDITNFIKIGGESPRVVTIGNLSNCMGELALISEEVYHKWYQKFYDAGHRLTKGSSIFFFLEDYYTYLDKYCDSSLENILI